MAIRYFKATDGMLTVFRSSETRVYFSASFTTGGDKGAFLLDSPAFSGKPPRARGTFPAIEITKAEYDALVAAKLERFRATGKPMNWASSPNESWVRNIALSPGEEG